MTEIIFNNVSKSFGDMEVVKSINLTIKDREFVSLVGPSGCGKTTTLNMLAGLEDITSGEIYIDGELINDVPPGKRDIAMVFQSYALYPHMNVYENLSFGIKLQKMKKSVIDEKIQQTSKLLGIENLLDRKPSQLSGGQRQRVSLGRALVRNPKAFLLDEPLSNLDAILRETMRSELKLLFTELNSTVVYVTHDQVEAMTMSDYIVVFNKGVVQQRGTPEEIYNRPNNTFVAEFIGSPRINLIDGKIVEDNNRKICKLPIKVNIEVNNVKPQIIKLGIRPEDIYIDSEGVNMEVKFIEQLGSYTVLHLEKNKVKLLLRTERIKGINVGENVPIKLNNNQIHIFNSKGERIN